MSDAVDPTTAAAATHGSFCPKMCSHACPVLRATGRPDAVPWSFHRTVADLADGRLTADDASGRLVACTGCHACAGACEVEGQDVPAQVRAGRAAVHAAGAADPAVARAAAEVAAGRSPYGGEVTTVRPIGSTGTVLLVGCRDGEDVVAAALRLLAAAGTPATPVAPVGCCGGVLRDLGDVAAADAARDALPPRLTNAARVVLLDPHCRGEAAAAAPGAEVEDLASVLAQLLDDGLLDLQDAPDVVWHEPCVLAGTAAGGRGHAALAASGALVELPGVTHRGCTGGGMGLPLLDPGAAAEVAAVRAGELGDTVPAVTGCAGAAVRLAEAGLEAHHLAVVLARLLDDETETVA